MSGGPAVCACVCVWGEGLRGIAVCLCRCLHVLTSAAHPAFAGSPRAICFVTLCVCAIRHAHSLTPALLVCCPLACLQVRAVPGLQVCGHAAGQGQRDAPDAPALPAVWCQQDGAGHQGRLCGSYHKAPAHGLMRRLGRGCRLGCSAVGRVVRPSGGLGALCVLAAGGWCGPVGGWELGWVLGWVLGSGLV